MIGESVSAENQRRPATGGLAEQVCGAWHEEKRAKGAYNQKQQSWSSSTDASEKEHYRHDAHDRTHADQPPLLPTYRAYPDVPVGGRSHEIDDVSCGPLRQPATIRPPRTRPGREPAQELAASTRLPRQTRR